MTHLLLREDGASAWEPSSEEEQLIFRLHTETGKWGDYIELLVDQKLRVPESHKEEFFIREARYLLSFATANHQGRARDQVAGLMDFGKSMQAVLRVENPQAEKQEAGSSGGQKPGLEQFDIVFDFDNGQGSFAQGASSELEFSESRYINGDGRIINEARWRNALTPIEVMATVHTMVARANQTGQGRVKAFMLKAIASYLASNPTNAIKYFEEAFGRYVQSGVAEDDRLLNYFRVMVARLNYEIGLFEKSLSWYEKVYERSSWRETARQERLWVLLRLNRSRELQKALKEFSEERVGGLGLLDLGIVRVSNAIVDCKLATAQQLLESYVRDSFALLQEVKSVVKVVGGRERAGDSRVLSVKLDQIIHSVLMAPSVIRIRRSLREIVTEISMARKVDRGARSIDRVLDLLMSESVMQQKILQQELLKNWERTYKAIDQYLGVGLDLLVVLDRLQSGEGSGELMASSKKIENRGGRVEEVMEDFEPDKAFLMRTIANCQELNIAR